ncbi:MAG: ABC transporter substrate-binding protein [Anaerolineae bacterium]|nr:ABC transporter substrate-binding protein [Anaerolineae bacterium]
MKRFAILMALLLLIVGSAFAQDEKVLVVGHAESTDSLDPARGYTQTTGIINHVTYETLVTFPSADASAILPLLATDWTISEDGLTYTFNLRAGVTFTNGDALTADDVVFSVMRLKYVGGSPSFLTANIASVTADDADTVTFTLSAVDPSFLSVLANNAFGITNDAQVTENGGSAAEDAATADAAESYLNGTSAGTGPYMLEAWEPLVQTVLVRNPAYWGTAPYFDRIIITNIPEAATQKVALESGEIDIALDLTADQIPSLQSNADVAIASTPGNIVHFILMNADPEIGGPVSNPLVTKAIRLALDYDGYAALWGGITPGTVMAVGQQYAFGPDKALARDLDAARALLAEAGFADGFDITLQYPTFTFQGVIMDTNAQKIQADLAEIGVNVTLEPGELGVSLEQYRSGQQGFAYWFWGPDVLDPIDMLAFVPGGKVANERALWTDERASGDILALRDRARVATDPAEREQLFTDIQTYMQESGAFAPFLQPNVQTAFAADLQGYVWHPQWLIDLAILSSAE